MADESHESCEVDQRVAGLNLPQLGAKVLLSILSKEGFAGCILTAMIAFGCWVAWEVISKHSDFVDRVDAHIGQQTEILKEIRSHSIEDREFRAASLEAVKESAASIHENQAEIHKLSTKLDSIGKDSERIKETILNVLEIEKRQTAISERLEEDQRSFGQILRSYGLPPVASNKPQGQ